MGKISNQQFNSSTTFDSSVPALQITEVTKYYGSFKGIEKVTLNVKQGEIHGFLGPNGAGKTTTIRIIVGLMGATAGSAQVFGIDAGTKEAKTLIGYLPSDFGLPRQYTVRQYLDFLEKLRGRAPYRQELVRRLELDETRKTSDLSKGNRQKVSIVQALMHEPKILVADEPTSGLDPLMQAEFNRYMKEYVNRGGTVFVSSHILADVQDICENITVIRHGNIVSSGSIHDLLSQMPRKIVFTPKNGDDVQKIASDIGGTLGPREFDKYPLFISGDLKAAIRRTVDHPNIAEFFIPQPSLEEYFMQIYAGEDLPEQ